MKRKSSRALSFYAVVLGTPVSAPMSQALCLTGAHASPTTTCEVIVAKAMFGWGSRVSGQVITQSFVSKARVLRSHTWRP